jgi:hypothetical protein
MLRPDLARSIPSGVVRVIAAAAVLLVAAGCGGGDPTTTSASAPTGPSTTSAGPTTTTTSAPEVTTTTLDGEGISELEALAPGLLVAATELTLTGGVQDLGYTPPGPLPACDFVLDDEVPPDLHVGTSLGPSAGLTYVVEAIRVYPDEATAAAAFDAAVANEEPCRAHQQGFTGPTDVNDRMGADRAVSFGALDRGGATEVFYALVGDALVAFVFPPPGDPSQPPPTDVAAFGIGKILAALEA